MPSNQAAVQSFQSTVDASPTYYGDYVITLLDSDEGTITIMQEIDELTLNMSIEE